MRRVHTMMDDKIINCCCDEEHSTWNQKSVFTDITQLTSHQGDSCSTAGHLWLVAVPSVQFQRSNRKVQSVPQ